MKKLFIIYILITIFAASDVLPENKIADKHKKKVISQHQGDLKNRDAVLRELNAFLKERNDEMAGGNLKLGIPVEESAVSDVKATDNFHYTGIIPPVIYGYVNTESLNMRSEESADSEIIGKIKFKERIQIISQSDKTELIKNMKAPWLLVKKDNGDEGWVFGAFVSDSVPSQIDSDTGKTDWNMILPVSGRLSSKFGNRIDPVSKRRNSFHKGIDISAPEGTPVYAAESGTVIEAGYKKSGYGNLVVIKHGSDLATYYGHLSKIIISSGDKVIKGKLIGKIGSTGKSTGPHLHFEIRKGNRALNPDDFVR